MKPRTRARTPSSIASNQSSKRKESAATAASFMVSLVMAWSPSGASTPESVGLEQPGDYANLIPTTSATEPMGWRKPSREGTCDPPCDHNIHPGRHNHVTWDRLRRKCDVGRGAGERECHEHQRRQPSIDDQRSCQQYCRNRRNQTIVPPRRFKISCGPHSRLSHA